MTSVPKLYLITKILVLIGFILTTFGVFMPFWWVTKDFHFGVFMGCFKTFKNCESSHKSDIMYKKADLFDLLWALSLSGMFALLLALLGICNLSEDHGKKAIAVLVTALLGIGVILILTALIVIEDSFVVLGTDVGDVLYITGWAWYLTVVGNAILFIGFICFIIHTCIIVCCNGNRVEPVDNVGKTNQYNDIIDKTHSRSIRQPYVNRSVYDERLFYDKNNSDWRSF